MKKTGIMDKPTEDVPNVNKDTLQYMCRIAPV